MIASYKKFVDQGITSPDALDLDDLEVKKANDSFDRWQKQEKAQTESGEESEYRNNLSKTMLYIDAGFTDPHYLEDVLGWLVQDAQAAEKQADNPDRAETRQQIAVAIKKVRGILEQRK